MSSPSGAILVADDEQQVRLLCARFLGACGYRVQLASDGREALDSLTNELPDVFVLDIVMPRMSGLELCRQLKNRHVTQHVPVILMTGMNHPDDVLAGLQAGADDYLCKPIRLSELRARIDNLVRRKQMFDTLQAHNEELIETLGDQSVSIAELYTLSQQMASTKSLAELTGVLTTSLARIMNCRRVSVMLVDKKAGALRLVGGVGIPQDMIQKANVRIHNGATQKIFNRFRPVVFRPGEDIRAIAGTEQGILFDGKSLVVVPMTLGNELLGALYLSEHLNDGPTPNEMALVSQISQAAAVAIATQLRQEQVRQTQDVTVFALAKLAESRDQLTGNHLLRVQTYSLALAERLQKNSPYGERIDGGFLDEIWRASPLHDIGKVGIPDSILLKPGKLTPDEAAIMQQHTIIGGRTLEAVESRLSHDSFLAMAREICYSHHERWDGSGYPFRLSGEAIPLAGRIVACADVYDALTTARPYKPAFPHAQAHDIIVKSRGSHFDPEVCDAFIALADEFNAINQRLGDETTSQLDNFVGRHAAAQAG